MAISSVPVILASSSAYRRALLSRVLPEFECLSPDIDETRQETETPVDLAVRLATAKAQACAAQRPDAVIIGSDQVPALGDEVLQKPGSLERAHRQLRHCAGKTVVFNTAVSIIGPGTAPPDTHIDKTFVRFRDLDDTAILSYLKSDQPFDCAGSFKVESRGIILFESIESRDPTGLQGLPLIWVAGQLRKRGVVE